MMAKLKPYAKMKNSGVEWLGDVPEHWRIQRLRDSIYKCINGVWGSDPNTVDDLPCVRVADFDRKRLRVREPIPTIRAIAMNERRHKLLESGDLLLEKSGGGEQQPVGIVILFDHDRPAVCSNFVARMPVREGFVSGYLTYLHAALYAIGVNRRSIKQTTGIQNLDSAAYLSESAAFPPLAEQTAIVRYLDYVDRRVQRLVAAKRKFIALLTEQKQALIHRAVTRGLDPDVPLKDSGVEWLGEVPSHWEGVTVRRLISKITSGSRGWAEFYSDNGDIFLQSGNLGRTLQLKMDNVQHVQPPDNAEGLRTMVRINDVLMCITGALTGNVVHVHQKINRAYINQHIALLRPNVSLVEPRYLAYALHSGFGQSQTKTAEYGGTKQGLGLDDVKSIWLPLPNIYKQKELVRYIDETTSQIQDGILQAEQTIDLLLEYRTRLIADVVTGKVDVREAAAALPEVDPLAGGDGADDS